MKIYFAGSIKGGRTHVAAYRLIVDCLTPYGEVLTSHVADDELGASGEQALGDDGIHSRDLGWITEADVLVADVTVPSTGVGYEIGRAVELGKRVICLCSSEAAPRVSAMIRGCGDITFRMYTDSSEIASLIRPLLSRGFRDTTGTRWG